MVRGEIAERAHDHHCGEGRKLTLTSLHVQGHHKEFGHRPTEHADGHFHHAGGMLGRRARGLQDGLQGGAAAFEHVKVGLGLRQVRLPSLRGQVFSLCRACSLFKGSIWLVPARQSHQGHENTVYMCVYLTQTTFNVQQLNCAASKIK